MEHEAVYRHIAQMIDLPEEDFAFLMGCARVKHLKKGEPLLKEGELCRAFYLVESGYLRTHYNKEGVPINLNFTLEGNFASNLKSFNHRTPSEVTIEAGEDSTVWVFTVTPLKNELHRYPTIARFIRRLFLRLLLASEEHSHLFKIYTPAERYRYIEQHQPQLLQRISLSQMASYLGVTRETLSRIRGKNQ